MGDTQTENLLTLTTAAERLAISVQTMHRHVVKGRVKAYLLGGRYRLKPSDLDKLLINAAKGRAPKTKASA